MQNKSRNAKKMKSRWGVNSVVLECKCSKVRQSWSSEAELETIFFFQKIIEFSFFSIIYFPNFPIQYSFLMELSQKCC